MCVCVYIYMYIHTHIQYRQRGTCIEWVRSATRFGRDAALLEKPLEALDGLSVRVLGFFSRV